MFASSVRGTVTLEDPSYGTVVVNIQKLSGRAIDLAATVRQNEFIAMCAKMTPQVLSLFKGEAVAPVESSEESRPAASTQTQRYASYDVDTVLNHGIVSWSIPKVGVTDKTIGNLELSARDKIFRAIIDLTFPPDTEEAIAEREERTKKD